jgi:prepilin-type N-terminal cleavage/methylation domain-containing protein
MIRNIISFSSREKGVSLVELMVTVVLIGIIAAVTARMLVIGAGTYDSVNTRNKVLHANRISFEMLTKDLRAIKSKSDITLANASQIIFNNLNDEQVNYSFSNGSLYRNSNLFVEGLSSFQFTYFDDEGEDLSSPVSTPSQIWEIDIAVDATVSSKPFHLESRLHPRNIQ